MFVLYANKNVLDIIKKEPITSGSINVYRVKFEFSKHWDGLERIVVFRAGPETRSVKLESDGVCNIPWEVLAKPQALKIGVYGTNADGDMILPTIWENLGTIKEGTFLGNDAKPPTPEIWRKELRELKKELSEKADNLEYDGLLLKLRSGEEVLSDVEIVAGGEGGGMPYKFGHGLKQDGLNVYVDTVNDFDGDNTLPITAAGVQKTIGNIEALLETI